MAERFMEEDVKTRLILSGLSELEARGAREFSLRRAAEAAGVSCAAPYRYFKDKEEYIAALISYLASKWELMANEILSAHRKEGGVAIAELCVANIRFWLSNKNIRTALTVSGEETSRVKLSVFDKSLSKAASLYLAARGVPEKDIEERVNSLRALLMGYITLIGSGELPRSSETLDSVKSQIGIFLTY